MLTGYILYAVCFVLLGGVTWVTWYFAAASRKTYACKQCGEKITTEYLDAKRCSSCGAPF